jgi:hypothetical protein
MAKILVAAALEPRAIVEHILAGHELFCAQTMAQAEQFLRERTFDLIICTIVKGRSRRGLDDGDYRDDDENDQSHAGT